jgi:hypothetical protein
VWKEAGDTRYPANTNGLNASERMQEEALDMSAGRAMKVPLEKIRMSRNGHRRARWTNLLDELEKLGNGRSSIIQCPLPLNPENRLSNPPESLPTPPPPSTLTLEDMKQQKERIQAKVFEFEPRNENFVCLTINAKIMDFFDDPQTLILGGPSLKKVGNKGRGFLYHQSADSSSLKSIVTSLNKNCRRSMKQLPQ